MLATVGMSEGGRKTGSRGRLAMNIRLTVEECKQKGNCRSKEEGAEESRDVCDD